MAIDAAARAKPPAALPAPASGTQLGLAGMPTRLYAATPARLTAWLDCPRRYRMTYLDRPPPPKGPPWAHTSVGASAHNALAAWWRLPPSARRPEAVGALVDAAWIDEGFRDAEQSAAARAQTKQRVADYVDGLDPGVEPVGVERVVAARTARLALSGRVDRIDRRRSESGDEAVIVDYKTGRRAPDRHDARSSLALAIYAVAAERTLRLRCRQVELHHLPTGEVAAAEHTDESLARHIARAESVAADSAAADTAWRAGEVAPAEVDHVFPPRPGPGCAWCDFARHCPEGRAAAPTKRPWEGIAV